MRLAVAVLAAVLSACTPGTRFRPATVPVALAPYAGEVRVLGLLPPQGEYVTVGVVIADGVFLTEEVDMLDALKREAAAHGANAVVLQGKLQVTRKGSGGQEKRLAAWAIRTPD